MDETNPFEVMNQYSPEMLEGMSVDELIEAQRSVLFPHEREAFDTQGSIVLSPADGRNGFFDFTDDLISSKESA